MSIFGGRALAGPTPIGDGPAEIVGQLIVMGQGFGCRPASRREPFLKRRSDATVQQLALSMGESRVGRILHQNMFEHIALLGCCPSGKFRPATSISSHADLTMLAGRPVSLHTSSRSNERPMVAPIFAISAAAPNRSICDKSRSRSVAGISAGMTATWLSANSDASRIADEDRTARVSSSTYSGTPSVRSAICELQNLGRTSRSGYLPRDLGRFQARQAAAREAAHMRPSSPGRHKSGTMGDQHQQPQLGRQIDNEPQQFPGRRVDPMSVLDNE